MEKGVGRARISYKEILTYQVLYAALFEFHEYLKVFFCPSLRRYILHNVRLLILADAEEGPVLEKEDKKNNGFNLHGKSEQELLLRALAW